MTSPAPRRAARSRTTSETTIDLEVALDGSGTVEVDTGLPFFDHMLSQLGRHGGLDLRVVAEGDLEIDAHHTVEDVGIALGEALAEAWGDKAGVRRFASIRVPLDEALVEASLDLSGRPFLHYEIDPPGEKILGDPPFDPQLAEEFWRALVTASAVTLHLTLVRGRNTHHIIEASFKAGARALRDAVRVEGAGVPSTKGVLSQAKLAVLDYGIGNLRSAEKALQHVGADARLTADRATIDAADGLVLPGVGAFGACMRALEATGLDEVARGAVGAGRPFLGICIGMQLLFDGSEEDPGIPGLGLVGGTVTRLPEGVKRPQMQWNRLDRVGAPAMLRGLEQPIWVYFVHSYAPVPRDTGDVAATCDYGGPVVAAVERGPLWATQFHPEKSGSVGLAMLSRFVDATAPSRATVG